MPPGGIERLPRDRILHPEEIGVLARYFVGFGIRKIRLTGGEPLIRGGFDAILKELTTLPDFVSLALTTNGILLNQWLDRLVDASVTRINISLDSLQRERYARITGVDGWNAVWTGLNAALNHPRIERVKLNVVVQRGINDDEINAFARLTLERPLDVRFIEMMPVSGVSWRSKNWMPATEILAKISETFEAVEVRGPNAGPASLYRLSGAQGAIGVISSLSRPACLNCNRLRLTAQGVLLRCLHDSQGLDLRRAVREKYAEEETRKMIAEFVMDKKSAGVPIGEPTVPGSHPPCLAAVGG
jgi:cyclic pyranopterin phosphate synthase